MTQTSDLSTPRFAAALSTEANTAAAVEEVCRQAAAQLAGPADLAVLFVSQHHGPAFGPLVAEIAQKIGAGCLIGCTGESIAGGNREIEETPAVSLWLARLPGVSLTAWQLEFQRTSEGGTFVGWPDDLPATWPEGSTLLTLAEPFSFPADYLLERLDEDQPHVPVLGGMASGAHAPGGNRLFFGGREVESGAVCVLLHGAVEIRSIVSQGCRPIGRPLVITKADGQTIFELSGKPALEQLQHIFDALSPEEQQLVQQGVHVGRVINEYQEKFGRGDFLVRNCLGADRKTGAIAVGDFVRPGQTIQFHVRDAQSADEDLRELLAKIEQPAGAGSSGALLFTCNGRGTRLFNEANHDAGLVAEQLGSIPLAGFFAQGEIGPVGGKNFLHGFTASIALFSARSSSEPASNG
jgi:small ligand-binding sensory domain FIST